MDRDNATMVQTLTGLELPGMLPIGIGAAVLLFAKQIHFYIKKPMALSAWGAGDFILPAMPTSSSGSSTNLVCFCFANAGKRFLTYTLLQLKQE